MGDFFEHLGKAAKNVGKKTLNIQAREWEIAANIGTASESKNPKLNAATAPEVIKICTSREWFIFGGSSLNIFHICIQFILGMT